MTISKLSQNITGKYDLVVNDTNSDAIKMTTTAGGIELNSGSALGQKF